MKARSPEVVKLFTRGQGGSGGHGSIDMRRATRYAANNLMVPLGKVIDLSATGMRLHCPRKDAPVVGSIERFVISTGTQRLAVKGQIVRSHKPVWPTAACDVGVRFLDTTQAIRAALEQLGMYGFIQGGRHSTGFKSAPTETLGASAHTSAASESSPPPADVRAEVEVGDLYGMLGVLPTATDDEIRAAFRSKARSSHPDASDDPHAEQIFADIAKAYKVLMDPAMRARYDSLLGGGSARHTSTGESEAA